MKQLFVILLLLCTNNFHAQSDGISSVDFAIQLSNLQTDISIGNACDDDVRSEIVIYGDFDMNGHTLELLNVKLTIINGQIVDEGEVIFRCANSEIRFEP